MLFAVNAAAQTVIGGTTSGKCGDYITWSYDFGSRTLTLTGSGRMYNYEKNSTVKAPWETEITLDFSGVHLDVNIKNHIDDVVIDPEIENIGNYAFLNASLKSINLENIKSIGTGAFENCVNLIITSLPTNATIGDDAFTGCAKMADEGVIYIGNTLVQLYESGKTSVTIKAGTTTIQKGAFQNKQIETITFADKSLTTIGDEAFSGCSNLRTLDIPNTVTTWGQNIFSGCTSLPDDGTYQKAGDHVIVKVVATATKETDYTIPGNIIYIAEEAFIGCTKAQNIFSQHSYGKMPKAASSAFDFDGFEPNYYVADGNEEACKTNWKAIESKINHTQITVGKTGYATVTILNHSAKVPDGIEAYTAKVEGDQVKLSKVLELAKGEGYILIGDTKTHDFGPAKYNVSKPKNNSMVGVTTDTEVSGYDCYVLCPADNGGVEFLCVGSETARITAGKSYLYVPNSPARLSIYNDNNETGIEETSEYYDTQNNNSIYNLAGQKLTQPKKGLNVINGKLVLM